MVSVTGTNLVTILNDANLTPAVAEQILDFAMDLLNLRGLDLGPMSGDEGSKAVSLESAERGAVFFVARAIYSSLTRGGGGPTGAFGPLNVTVKDLLSDPAVLAAVDKAAEDLKSRDIDWSGAFL